MQASMSRKGNCYDNVPMESFWGSLKNELIHHQRYAAYSGEHDRSFRPIVTAAHEMVLRG
jgi:transposase InsO family protein